MLFKICHIEHSNNFGILAHNLDIPDFFATTAIRYFLGYLVDLGYVGYPIFFLPQRQYYHILVFWDIPILIRHIQNVLEIGISLENGISQKKSATTKNGIWHSVGYPISHSRHNTWVRKVTQKTSILSKIHYNMAQQVNRMPFFQIFH